MKAKMTRRILALALCLAMVLTMIPAAFASSFADVPDDAWYTSAVEYCFENKLMSGTGSGFEPNGKVTREMAVQTLYSMAGKPEVEYEAIFTDVPDGKWYTNAIMWGAKNGIVAGDGKGHFNVGVNVTREQMAMFFYNYAKFVGMDEDFASLKSFPDHEDVSSWAKTALQWAVEMGVLSGKKMTDGNTYLKPKDPLTRAELASILSRFAPQAPAACNHENTEIRDAKEATCVDAGYTGDTWCLICNRLVKKGEEIKALGHIDEDGDKWCDRCDEWMGTDDEKVFTLADAIYAGQEVVIYNPGHTMAIKNETDNDWYLVPEAVTPEDNKITNPDASIVWTVIDNGDGTVSFANGENKIAAWVSGTYIELTNNAEYEGADTKWVISYTDGLAYIQSSSLSNSYGPAYIECYYNSTKDVTKISGYTSSNPTAKSTEFGFQFYSFGKTCSHVWEETEVVAPTCTEDGYTLYTCSKCGATKTDNVVAATGHNYVDGVCVNCGEKQKVFTLATSISAGQEVVIYSPGHGMAIKNETDNNWYLVPEAVTPEDDKISNPDASIVWTVVDNGDGTVSFTNGDNAIAAWVSGTYIELTNDANYEGADTKWVVSFVDGLGYIKSSSLSNDYGPAYIECYYNSNKDTTKISGYTSSDPTAKSTEFGFQFYVSGDVCEHDWVAGEIVAPTCVDDGYTLYTCSKCQATKKDDVVAATGHFDENADGFCDVCQAALAGDYALTNTIKSGDEVVIYNAGNGKAIAATMNSYYVAGVDVTPINETIASPDATIVWTVTVNEDGTYTFTNGSSELGADSTTSNDKTYNNLYIEAGHKNTWTLETCNEGNKSFVIYNAAMTGSYGHIYLEWYAAKSGFSAYDTSAERATETNFGFQFYVKGAEVCQHDWTVTDTVAATCTTDGYTTYTCSKCQATKTDDVVAATGHNYVDGVCANCGAKEPTNSSYILADSITDGDQVIIYNAGSGKAVPAVIKSTYYLDGVDVTPADDAIATDDTTIVWTVTANEDGSYTFTNADSNILSINYNTDTQKTSITLDGANPKMTLESCNAENKSYYIYSATQTGKYEGGHVYLEWYASYSDYSAYSTSADRVSEANFGFQFYVLGTQCDHDWQETGATEPSCTEPGYTNYVCSLCQKTKSEATVAALGHDWVADAENTQAPTCILAGVNAFKCSRCTETTTEAGEAALGHIDEDSDNICDRCQKKLDEAGYTVASSIEAGDKIIIVATHNEINYAAVGVLGDNDTKVNNALSARTVLLDGTSIADASVDETAIVWTVEAGSADGTFLLKASDGKYLAYTASGTTLKTAATGTDFAVTCGSGTSTVMCTAEGMTSRGVSFRLNGTTPQFRAYMTSNNSGEWSWAITIYKLG